MPTKVCEQCGKEFIPIPHNAGRFCSRKCYWDKGGNFNRRDYSEPRLNPTEPREWWHLSWAAGVYEGEGTCHGNPWTQKNGTVTFSPAVRINQVDPWLCNRLRAIFGGSVRLRHNSRDIGGGNVIGSTAEIIGTNIAPRPFEIFEWNLNGSRAREFLREIYPHLSPRRQGQVRKAFGLDIHP